MPRKGLSVPFVPFPFGQPFFDIFYAFYLYRSYLYVLSNIYIFFKYLKKLFIKKEKKSIVVSQ